MAPKPRAAIDAGIPKAKAKDASAAVEKQPPAQAGRTVVDGEAVAREVLRLVDAGQNDAVLRVLGDGVVPGAEAAVARKAFLRISMLIHPDKLPGFADATRAFQCLVTAFDQTQAGTGFAAKAAAPKHATLGRSSEACFRTQVQCPRCQVPWGLPAEGNPDYFYNFMMQGLRCFTCSTCLLNFGCLTAVHKCPWCPGTFEYLPDKYHHKVTCGNAGCKRPFGFTMFHASEQALKQAREQVQAELEKRKKLDEGRSARSRRAARRSADEDENKIAEAAFAMGLRDTCPRCGVELETFEEGEQLRHLRTCKDTAAHRAHQERERSTAKATEVSEKKAKAQLTVASGAVWSFTGGRVTQLWMLTVEQLRERCSKEHLPTKGSRAVLIGRIVEKCGKRDAGHVDLPDNIHSLSDENLAAVCAAHGLKGGSSSSREERLDELEELRLIEPTKKVAALKGKAKVAAIKDKSKAPLALMDKNYLKKKGQRVVAGASGAATSPKAKSKAGAKDKGGGLSPQAKKRRKVVPDD